MGPSRPLQKPFSPGTENREAGAWGGKQSACVGTVSCGCVWTQGWSKEIRGGGGHHSVCDTGSASVSPSPACLHFVATGFFL